jgi:antibiotic biosynthesis monooxygenase (ABM) superfamily enzyme
MNEVGAASAIITTRVAPERHADFLRWQKQVSDAESHWPGFVAHRVEQPVDGVQEDWVVGVTFADPEALDAWLRSSERAALMRTGAEFSADQRLTRTARGFGFWSRDTAPDPVFKSNLLILLMLYPLVFLWGYFVSAPLIDSHGVPFWLSLFIGNVVSTQLLGWLLAPWIFRRFRWWLNSPNSVRRHVFGYALLIGLYVVSMALFAWLDSLR